MRRPEKVHIERRRDLAADGVLGEIAVQLQRAAHQPVRVDIPEDEIGISIGDPAATLAVAHGPG